MRIRLASVGLLVYVSFLDAPDSLHRGVTWVNVPEEIMLDAPVSQITILLDSVRALASVMRMAAMVRRIRMILPSTADVLQGLR
jgi:hypothetical protein